MVNNNLMMIKKYTKNSEKNFDGKSVKIFRMRDKNYYLKYIYYNIFYLYFLI